MAIYDANKYAAGIPALTGSAKGDVLAVKSTYTAAATLAFTDGDIIRLAKIPAGHEILSVQIFTGDLESSTAALTFSLGLLTHSDHVALDTVFVADSTLGRAGGTLAIPTTTTVFTTDSASADKVLAIEITATATAASGAEAKIGVVVMYAPV